MSVRIRLILSLCVPMLGLVAFSGVCISRQWQTFNDMSDVQYLVNFSTKVSALIHETQKERGATAGFLGSNDGSFDSRLQEQRLVTDKELAELERFLSGFKPEKYGGTFHQEIIAARDLISNLSDVREDVSERSISTKDAIGFYTQINARLLNAVGKSSLSTRDAEMAVRINAYVAFLKSKELAGIERAVLANTFAQDRFGPDMYGKFVEIVALQESFMNEFLLLATVEDTQIYHLSAKEQAFSNVDGYRQKATSKPAGGFGEDPNVWFETITVKINHLKDVDDQLARNLLVSASDKSLVATLWLIGIGVMSLLVIVGASICGWQLIRRILGSVNAIDTVLHSVISGDLTRRVDLQTKDEFGRIASSLDTAIAELSQQTEEREKQLAENEKMVAELSQQREELSQQTEERERQLAENEKMVAELSQQREELSQQTEEREKQLAENEKMVLDALHNAEFIDKEVLKISAIMARIADGDLTTQYQVGDAEESASNIRAKFFSIAESINSMLEKMQSVIGCLQSNSEHLAGSAAELSATATQLAATSEQTTGQSTNVASAAEEMSTNMENMSKSTQKATGSVRDIAESVEQLNGNISAIASATQKAAAIAEQAEDRLNASSDQIADLDVAAGEIGNVIEVIQDIAEQTNLLALNATIEAARAGEAGKGFAVVASEVKELARQTSGATGDIRDRIERIQATSDEVVRSIAAIGDVIRQVNESSVKLSAAVEAQNKITADIAVNLNQSSESVRNLSFGVEEAAVFGREVAENISGVNTATKETSDAANQLLSFGTELTQLAEQLKTSVREFHIEQNVVL